MKEKTINWILAALLLATILLIGGVTAAKNYRALIYAAAVTYKQYEEPEGGIFSGVSARIAAITNTININLFEKDWFEKLNARLQLGLGKQMLSFGGTTMVKLNSGHLYDLLSDVDVSDDVSRMVTINDHLKEKGVPLLFVYAHGSLYEDGLLPEGVKDYGNKVADDIVKGLRDGGVTTMDSRDVMKNSSLTLDEMIYATDQHWSIRTAFTMAGAIEDELAEISTLRMDERLKNIKNFDIHVYAQAHMGDVGARVGAGAVRPDDFTLITPKYDTHIHQRIKGTDGWQERDGSFEEAVLNTQILNSPGSSNRYDSYGYHTEAVYYTNEDAPEGRLLVVKDSFGTPVASFLSLGVRELCAIDLRKGQLTVEEYVDSFKPDAVVVVHCQEMMRGRNYVFVDE